ncbi:hypothetical protein FDB44_17525 [Clostridium botulinum]|uniref:hypothetical protein n=1 Tax=Clostridium botulinum TaxID=1491 RepID=UPI0013F0F546|nr:hypothetical protein [Clostridium botulinum]MBY6935176.1 hypothetical protein [Clostridium botulinum]NFL84587.1 hypothetical protein [Clostridium botulinum]NFN12775.1 hypothetical protein [Clostridium botulinum]NFO38455.1 hypothetical protein [Clostridium botulinum]NFO44342.1 hypothetical protein [Clostridium botulinum]
MEYKTIINKTNGKIIDLCVMFIDGEAQYFEIKNNYIAVERYKSNFVKPKWVGTGWIEEATEEEIQKWEESNNPVEKEPTEDEILMSNILLENATLKQKTSDLEEMTANVMLQIAELKGGNINA